VKKCSTTEEQQLKTKHYTTYRRRHRPFILLDATAIVMSSVSNNATFALELVVACGLTAAVTYYLTSKGEQRKYLEEKKAIYDREIEIKKKTLAARELTGEPKGTVIEDVTIDKTYLWEVEDLKKRFPPSKIENVMKNVPPANSNPYFFPSIKREKVADPEQKMETKYNKLITNHECILADIVRKPNAKPQSVGYVRAGPRKLLHFDPDKVNAAIVTCGGLCPGLNNVIREIVNSLVQLYGIKGKVYGIQGGYRGFWDFDNYMPIELTPKLVANIHHEGGTVLGSSRGGFELEKILDFLKERNITCLFVIGGDGTHRGAFRIHEGCMERVSTSVFMSVHVHSCYDLFSNELSPSQRRV
jgi:6-phosphofructokinase 1